MISPHFKEIWEPFGGKWDELFESGLKHTKQRPHSLFTYFWLPKFRSFTENPKFERIKTEN